MNRTFGPITVAFAGGATTSQLAEKEAQPLSGRQLLRLVHNYLLETFPEVLPEEVAKNLRATDRLIRADKAPS